MNLSALSIVVLALVCLAGVAGQWLEQGAGWWRYLLAVWLLGLLYEWVRMRQIRFTVELTGDRRLHLGREEVLTCDFHNPQPRAQDLQFVPRLPGGVELAGEAADNIRRLRLAGGQSRAVQFLVCATELGEFPWPRIPARTAGALGLAWWPLPLEIEQTLEVVPDLAGAAEGLAGNTRTGTQTAHIGSGVELHHVRDYVPGDPRQAVDWKASAKLGKLITRVRSEEQNLQIMLVVDAGRTARTRIDGLSQLGHYVNLCSRFAQRAVAQGDQVGLVVAAAQPLRVVAPAAGVLGARQVRIAVSSVPAEQVETDMLSAALQVDRLVAHRSLIILLTDLYGQSLSGNFGRSLRLWGRRHLPVVVSLLSAELALLGEQPAQLERDAYLQLAADEYQRTVNNVAGGARRMGAHPVVTPAAELEQRVYRLYQQLKQSHRI